MTNTALSIALAALLTVLACTVSADWQYTKWGMSVNEVIEASDGKATRIDDPALDTERSKAKAAAPFVAGEFEFEAVFHFGRKDRKLQSVRLTLKQGSRHSLYAALVNRYGKPVSEWKSEVMETAKWADAGNNNSVVLLVIGDIENVGLGTPDMTSVQYSPLIGEAEEKL